MRSSNIFNWKILALGAAIVVAYSGSAAAEVDDETREACRPDAWRLCAAFIPNVDRITECMSAKIKEVSPACRAAMIHEGNKTRAQGRGVSAEDQ
jgi:hypothetical protein